jgi:hypothetical protein
MSKSRSVAAPRRGLLGRWNLVVLALALIVLVVGYLVLEGGHPGAAAALLVLGYCVLVPLGIAL